MNTGTELSALLVNDSLVIFQGGSNFIYELGQGAWEYHFTFVLPNDPTSYYISLSL